MMMGYSCLSTSFAILLISSTFRAKAQIITACTTSMISSFTPCFNYVTGSSGSASSPTEDCCNSLKYLMTHNMDCVCLIVTGNVPVSVPFINANIAIALPRVCKSSVPLQCTASGVPLPAPGPVLFGPPPPPAPTPAPAPAPAPAAPTPTPHTHSPKASNPTPKASKATAAPLPAGSLDIAPTTPPKFPSGPSLNPWIRPVVNPNSASTQFNLSLPTTVLMLVGIMASNFC